MLGVLRSRPKPRILAIRSLINGVAARYHRGLLGATVQFTSFAEDHRRRHHSSACLVDSSSRRGAASIWHAILPSSGDRGSSFRPVFLHDQKGEGSWNVAWDARPARWLHRPDSAWLLFGVCACLTPLDSLDADDEVAAVDDKIESCNSINKSSAENNNGSSDYRVTGVRPDGRCLFRSIAHVACLRSGEEAPDENRQRELADELRAQVVDELLKRREETEWFIEGNFDAYVKSIQQPYVWGGEPELMMASHVLKMPISVFMKNRSSGDLRNIANYGKEYRKGEDSPINVLFHEYGHYEILETFSDHSYQKLQQQQLLMFQPIENFLKFKQPPVLAIVQPTVLFPF